MFKPLVIKRETIDKTLANEPKEGRNPLNPFTSVAKDFGATLTLLEDHKVETPGEVHRKTIDFFYCLEGQVEFVTEGDLIEPKLKVLPDGSVNDLEIRAKGLSGGDIHQLQAGDMIWIPAGMTHMHKTKTTARMLAVKVLAEREFPLEKVKSWADS